jgi:hypothetical protein
MFKCYVLLPLPLAFTDKPEVTPIHCTIATYTFDPGLQVDDEVKVGPWNIGHGGDKPFSCSTRVSNKSREVVPKAGDVPDTYRLIYFLEIADKEDVLRVCEIFKSLNPGKFV